MNEKDGICCHFATCDRKTAMQFLERGYPTRNINFNNESISAMLDLIENDVMRVQDPQMHGSPNLISGQKYSSMSRDAILAICRPAIEALNNSPKKQEVKSDERP